MVAVAAIAAVLLLWQRLDQVQQELVRRATDVGEQAARTQALVETSEATVQALQARLVVAEVRLSEVSLQRTQLEELMLSVSRSRDDTLVLDIESGLRLAMQQAELTGSAQALLSALFAADQRIARAAQPRLNPVQRAIGRDMDRIKASPLADLPALAGQLDELARAVDDLPLLNAEPKSVGAAGPNPSAAPAAPAGPAAAEPMAAPAIDIAAADGPAPNATATTPGAAADVPAKGKPPVKRAVPATPVAADGQTAPDEAVSPWAGLHTRWTLWWDSAWASVSRSAQDLVRVGRIQQPDAVLLAPDQSLYLRENIKIKLLNARLSLLSRQVPAARVDMQAVRSAVQKYFDPAAPATRKTVQTLTEALQATRSVVVPRPDESLAALAAAARGR